MIARAISRPPASFVVAVLAAAALAAASCQKVPLLAPSGSVLTLTASTTAMPANGSTEIIAQLIEPSGTPPHSGTQIIFTTSLGTIQPSTVETDINGRATATFNGGGQNGTATITAASGGVSTGANGSIKILVGAAGVGRVNVFANPTTVPAFGGTTTITASVIDINGNILSGVPVTFSTSAGLLGNSLVTTDTNGNAQTTLQTSQQATVTATVGATGGGSGSGTGTGTGNGTGTGTGGGTGTGTGGTTPTPPTSGQASGTVTVGISAAPSLVIKPPTTQPSVGVPAVFTFSVTAATTNGSAVKDLFVRWGDGDTQDLGAVTGDATVSHVYSSARTFTVQATITDSFGNSNTVSTAVTVIPVPRPSINIQATPGQTGTFTANVTITITAPQGIGIQDVTIDWGDGTAPQDLGGAPTGTINGISHVYSNGAGRKHITVSVLDTTGQVTIGTADVNVS